MRSQPTARFFTLPNPQAPYPKEDTVRKIPLDVIGLASILADASLFERSRPTTGKGKAKLRAKSKRRKSRRRR